MKISLRYSPPPLIFSLSCVWTTEDSIMSSLRTGAPHHLYVGNTLVQLYHLLLFATFYKRLNTTAHKPPQGEPVQLRGSPPVGASAVSTETHTCWGHYKSSRESKPLLLKTPGLPISQKGKKKESHHTSCVNLTPANQSTGVMAAARTYTQQLSRRDTTSSHQRAVVWAILEPLCLTGPEPAALGGTGLILQTRKLSQWASQTCSKHNLEAYTWDIHKLEQLCFLIYKKNKDLEGSHSSHLLTVCFSGQGHQPHTEDAHGV